MKKVLLLSSLAALAFASCNLKVVKGNGHVITKTFNETGFRDIDVSSSMDVILRQGPDYNVRIEAEDNILELMKVRKEGDKLVIGFKNHININTSRGVKVYITAPDFHKLDGSGACNFTSSGMLSGNALELDLSGASHADLNLEIKKLDIDASGASEIALKGRTVDFAIDGSGSTSVKAFGFMAENVDIGLSGAGEAEVHASRSLTVDISGAGDVKYKGNPANVHQETSGAGSVNKVE